MNCDQYRAQLSRWLEGELSPREIEAMLAHEAQCGDCSQLTEVTRLLLEETAQMGTECEVPPQAGSAWRRAVRSEPEVPVRRRPFFWPGAVAAVAVVALGIGVTALRPDSLTPPLQEQASFSLYSKDIPMEDYADAAPAMARTEGGFLGAEAGGAVTGGTGGNIAANPIAPVGTMLKRSADLTLTTEQFDLDAEALLRLPEEQGGWISYQSFSGRAFAEGGEGRFLNLTLRVPADHLEDTLSSVNGIGSVESSSTYAEDLYEQYYDVQGRLDSALALRGQLEALLSQATEVDSLIALTQELGNNQYIIDQLQGQARGMESRVQYSEVRILLRETRPLTIAAPGGTSLFARMRNGFVDSINAILDFLGNAVVMLVWLLPWVIPIGVILWLVLWGIRRRKS